MVACWASTVASGCTLSTGRGCGLLYVVAFFDVEVRDAAEGGGADVDVGLGLDLAGAADDGDEILAHDLAGGDLGDAGLAVSDGAGGDAHARTRTMTTRMMIFFVLIQLSSLFASRLALVACVSEFDVDVPYAGSS